MKLKAGLLKFLTLFMVNAPLFAFAGYSDVQFTTQEHPNGVTERNFCGYELRRDVEQSIIKAIKSRYCWSEPD
jgi:hypothetical protein